MKNLSNTIKFLAFFFGFLVFSSLSVEAYASSAYVSPTSGLITVENFKVSFYVESGASEPEMAGANLKITYPANVKVVSVNNGEFDSYLEKVDNPATREISINAVNSAGNFKSGKVKVASVDFQALEKTGQVQLTISSTSQINGAGGEQLLTETINGVYNLSLPETTAATSADTSVTSIAVGSPSVTTTSEAVVPATGIGDNKIVYYLIISISMIGLGVTSLYRKSDAW